MPNLTGQTDRDRILEATDLVSLIGDHIALKRKGNEFVGLCPFHDDHNPSMCVVPHKNFYKCFVCGAGGNAIDFVMKFLRMEFVDALRFLGNRAGIELQARSSERRDPDELRNTDLLAANKTAMEFFQATLDDSGSGQAVREILKERGISDDIARQFGVGLAPDRWDGLMSRVREQGSSSTIEAFVAAGLVRRKPENQREYDTFRNRIIFPICNQIGQPVAFGARRIKPDDDPKYLNSPETPVFHKSRTLYGLHLARKTIGDEGVAIVCEGYTDVIAMHQAGFTNAVATLGTALTIDHARILKRLCDTIILLFDGDEAGQRAANRAIEVFFAEPLDVKICVLRGGIDPDDLLRSEGGPAAMRAALDSANDALFHSVQRFRREVDQIQSLSGRQQLLETYLQHLADLGLDRMSGNRKSLVLPLVADALGMSLRQVESALPRGRRQRTGGQPSNEATVPTLLEADGSVGGTPQNRARRENEANLLAILLHDPAVRSTHVDAGEGHRLPVSEIILPDSITDPSYRSIYRQVHRHFEADQDFTVHDLTRDLPEPELQQMVIDLALRGDQLCGDDHDEAVEQLEIVCGAFLHRDEREQAHTRSVEIRQEAANNEHSTGSALLEAIAHRRRFGDNYTDNRAIARGIRS